MQKRDSKADTSLLAPAQGADRACGGGEVEQAGQEVELQPHLGGVQLRLSVFVS